MMNCVPAIFFQNAAQSLFFKKIIRDTFSFAHIWIVKNSWVACELISDMYFFWKWSEYSKNIQRNWVVGMVTNQHNELTFTSFSMLFMCKKYLQIFNYSKIICWNNILFSCYCPSGLCNSWDAVPDKGTSLLWWGSEKWEWGRVGYYLQYLTLGPGIFLKILKTSGFSFHLAIALLSNIQFSWKILRPSHCSFKSL